MMDEASSMIEASVSNCLLLKSAAQLHDASLQDRPVLGLCGTFAVGDWFGNNNPTPMTNPCVATHSKLTRQHYEVQRRR